MNLKPEQIPKEVLEAAFDAWCDVAEVDEYRVRNSRESLSHAIAAALPVLLGEPVAWVDPSDLLELKRGGCGGITCGTYSKRYGRESPLYAIPTQDITLPTQDTPNADQ